MTNELIARLGSPALERATEKRLFGKPYIRLGRLVFVVGSWFFARAALLGYGLRSEPVILGKLLGSPVGEELPFVQSIREDAESRLRETPADEFNLSQMYTVRELRLMGIEYPTWPPNKALERKWDLVQAYILAVSAFEAGAAVGYHFPDRFQACWENSVRIEPAEEWQAARAAGLDLPETQEENPLEENLWVVLQITAACASEYGAQRFSSDELAVLARMAENPKRPRSWCP
jgi:hypothetical protein